jgi:hypothetical protein
MWSIDLEPEVENWLDSLSVHDFAVTFAHIERLAERGNMLRMPASRSLGDGLLELRFDLGRLSWRVTYWFAPNRRIVLLTIFRKQRQNERSEVQRARWALTQCITEQHTAEEN